MRLSVLAAGTALLLCPSVAMVQTSTPATQPDAARSTTASPTTGTYLNGSAKEFCACRCAT